MIADSIFPIFYRNLWNVGVFALQAAGAGEAIGNCDVLSVDVATGVIENLTGGGRLRAATVPSRLLDVFVSGGLLRFMEGLES